MNEYREKIKVQLRIYSLCAGALLACVLWALGAEFWNLPFPEITGPESWVSGWRGFISGACSGVLILMCIGLVRIRKALQDPEKLKKLYIKETDERENMVCKMAGTTALRSFLLLGMVASIIAGFFSISVALTIAGCILVQSFLTIGFLMYYKRKF